MDVIYRAGGERFESFFLGPVITRFSRRWNVYLAWSRFEMRFYRRVLVVGRLIDGADSMNGNSSGRNLSRGKLPNLQQVEATNWR